MGISEGVDRGKHVDTQLVVDEGPPWDLAVLGVGTARSPLRQRKMARRGGLKGPSESVGTSESIGWNS